MIQTMKGIRGFTLIEVVVVLIVVGYVTSKTIYPVTAALTHTLIKKSLAKQEFIIEALYGYTIIHEHLPWADTDGDGIGNAGALIGTVPYADLGVNGKNAWGIPFKYIVDIKYTSGNAGTNKITVHTWPPTLEIKRSWGEDTGGADMTDTRKQLVPAIVLDTGTALLTSQAETENNDGDSTFVDESYIPETNDDVVLTINHNILMDRMMNKAKLLIFGN